jgi:hypothetical protein
MEAFAALDNAAAGKGCSQAKPVERALVLVGLIKYVDKIRKIGFAIYWGQTAGSPDKSGVATALLMQSCF